MLSLEGSFRMEAVGLAKQSLSSRYTRYVTAPRFTSLRFSLMGFSFVGFSFLGLSFLAAAPSLQAQTDTTGTQPAQTQPGQPAQTPPSSLPVQPPPAASQSQTPRPTSRNNKPLPPTPTIDTNVNQNDTLANVRYNNKYEAYGGFAYSHFNAGPSLIEGSNLGGFDLQGTRWLTGRFGATANVRGYYGTNGVDPNPYGIRGPLVFEHLFMGGATIRGISKPRAAVDFHALVGGAYGDFQHALGTVPPQNVGLFSNSATFATALGGSLDLNRSPKLALRISPDYILTRYGGVNQHEFAISVGILYRFKLGKGPSAR